MMKKSVKVSESAGKKVKRVKKTTRKPAKDKREENALLDELGRISINARRRAQSKKASVTIIRNGEIVMILHNKEEQIIGKVKRTTVKINLKGVKRIK